MKKKFYLALIITGFSLYFFSLFGEFLWDDEEQIVNNEIVHSIGNIFKLFKGSTFNTGGNNSLQGIYYKPILNVSYSLLYSIFGAESFFFHLFQVSLHILNSILILKIFNFIFKERVKINNKICIYSSFIISLIFLTHPINVESVAYISALQETLFLFWGALGFYLLLIRKSKRFTNLSEYLYLAIISVCLLMGILSKESGILFIIITGIYSIIFESKSYSIKLILSLFITFLVYLFMRFIIAGVALNSSEGLSPIMRVDLSSRLICIPKIIFLYFKTYLYPKDLFISHHWLVDTMNFKEFYLPLIVLLTGLIALSLVGILLYRKTRDIWRIYIFFLLWLVIGLALHIQIIPLDMTFADRWFYFPQIGLLGILFCMFYVVYKKYITRDKYNKTILYSILILISFLSVRTFNRTLDWSNGYTLYQNDIKLNPDAYDLTNNIGVESFRQGELDEAGKYFLRSTELAPYWWTNWNNLGVIYEREGNLEEAGKLYRKSIKNGDYFLAYENLASILYKQERYEELRKFLEEDALLKFPYNRKLNLIYFQLKEQDN